MVPDRFMRASCCINPSQLKISIIVIDNKEDKGENQLISYRSANKRIVSQSQFDFLKNALISKFF